MLSSIQRFSGIVLLGFILSCNQSPEADYRERGFEIIHQSEEFLIYQKEDEFILKVIHPFPASASSESYHLMAYDKEFYELEGITHQIHYPISRISISSTTHLGYIEALGMQDYIVGASNPKLFYSESFSNKVDAKEVMDIGGSKFNKELLIKLAPDLLFAFALGPDDLNIINDLRNSGIKVVLVSEFLEADPLGKAEWLKFFAAFFGADKLQKSKGLLESIRKQYDDIKQAVADLDKQPEVMVGYPWKGSWYVSGGNSFQAQFYQDAGADYIWSDFKGSGSVPLDLEVVLKEGAEADYWLNPGDKQSIKELLDANPNFKSFKSMEDRNIYSNYGRSNSQGANDIWERGVVRPDLILKDLASIFHPEIMGDGDLYFYKRLEE